MLSIAPGRDAKYLTRQVGRGAENYYLSSVAEHGEPPGVWWGEGARTLGLEPGTEIDGAVFEKLYETFLDPRDPNFLDSSVPDEEKARLGRRKTTFRSWEEIYATKVAAEPEASLERLAELKYEAKGEARQAVIHLDATFSPSKSVTLVHAGLLAAASEAEAAGNVEQAAQYREAAGVVWDGVMAGADASLRYLQEHAGEARVGYHGAKIAGRTTGRWVEAGGWVVGRFRQHTNREGDPQLHVHQAILNRQQTADGKWVTLDSRAVFKARPGAAAHGERAMEEYLSRRLGLEFRARPDGNGREVVGVSPEMIAEFSSRRVQVTEDLERRVAAYVAAHGREPSPRVLFKMAQDATKATKAPKTKEHAVSEAERLRQWEERARAEEIGQLSGIPEQTLGRIPQGQPARSLAEADVDRVLQAALADVQRGKAEWTRPELTRMIDRHLPDYLGGLHPERVEALLESLTDMALGNEAVTGVRLLNAPDEVTIPADLQRPDGRSVYLAQAAERYTTVDQLDREAALTAAALGTDAPRVDPERAAALVGPSVEEAKEAALRGAPMPEGMRPFADQAAALTGILTSGRRVDVLVGPAGTGKSFTVGRLAEIWRSETGTPVLGLTTSQNAAGVLQAEGLDSAMNIERWLTAVNEGEASLQPGQLVLVDEASMVTTDHLARIQQLADAAGAKVLWSGDDHQLSAPGAGGAMRRLVTVGGAHQLSTVVRFREEWEREASIALRDGLPEALRDYDEHGRFRDGSREEMETLALDRYLSDYLAGRQSLLLVGTNEKAAELSGRIRDELVALGIVAQDGARLADGNTAGRGDLIMARRNTEVEENEQELTNRDVLQVGYTREDGALLARRVERDGTLGETVELPASYVRQHVELGYAGTVHAAQGRTVDTCHSIPDHGTTAEALYVMLTRGRDGNYAYVPLDLDRERAADLRPGPEQARDRAAELLRGTDGAWSVENPLEDAAAYARGGQPLAGDRIAILSSILTNREADKTAIEAMIEEGERPRNLGHLGAMMVDQIREKLPLGYVARAEERGMLTAEDAARLRDDEALGTLGRLLHQIELSGRSADRILDAAIAERELDTAESLAKTLHWRITEAAKARGIDLERLEISEDAISGTWRDRIPTTGIPETDQFLAELADRAQMRQTELGYSALHQPPAWLAEILGEPPAEDLSERQAWAERAGAIAAYREQYGYDAESDAIGPAPARTSPEQRAAWWAAYDAMGRPDASREIVSATDGELWAMRAAYEREARWAPAYVGEELGMVSREAQDRAAEAVRLRARADAVRGRDADAAAALDARAAGQEALAAAASDRREVLTRVHEARQAWHERTRDAALMAMRADAELRRREHIDAEALPPLHVDTADAAERQAQQRAAEQARAEAERDRAQVEGQLELDLGAQVERVAAWDEPQQAEPQQAEPSHGPAAARQMEEWDLVQQQQAEWDRRRRAWSRGEVEELPEDPRDHEMARRVRLAEAWAQHELDAEARQRAEDIRQSRDRAEADRAAEVDRTVEHAQAPEHGREPREQQAQAAEPAAAPVEVPEPIPGQQTLDVFGVADQVDREAQPELAERLDKAAAASAIAEARRDREAEQERAQREQTEREQTERDRAQEREQERAEVERARLEARERARADRDPAAREADDAAEIVRAAYPQSIREALADRGRRPDREPYRPPEPPSRDDGLSR
ncbi:MobF family relaxase [Actinomadura sp. WAC 06369]|uniref:MobF family relaxase n=1 Tax=Actinomadura sp. WAC 06369 TaxID=2203193 RepID=UPI000F77554F|nr:MobF family relaxase [Actinomadura sp. WAC 06369]RSN51125.1 hypothetical protein DMH08_31355 [Actinomadura sp. WAC 06369]